MWGSSGRALGLLAVFGWLAVPAQAQTRSLFVGGGIVADDDRTNSRLTDEVTRSWNFLLGLDVSPYVGLRVVVDAPRRIRETAEGVYTRAGGRRVSEKLTRTKRSMTLSFLADLHGQVAPRLRLAFTCGLVEVTHDEETIIVREELRPDGTRAPLPDESAAGDYPWHGWPAGLEMQVQVTERVEIVPEVRTIFFFPSDSPHPYIIRTGVGLRWRF